MTRALSRIVKAALVLLVLLSIPVGLILLRPELLLGALARSSAAELGYEITSMQVSRLGLSSIRLSHLSLRAEAQALKLSDIEAHYSLSQLLAARVESVQIGELEVLMLTAQEPASEEPSTLAALLEALDDLPLASLSLPNINILTDDNSYEIGMSLQSPPLRAEGLALSDAAEGVQFSFNMQRAGSTSVDIQSRAVMQDKLIFESDMNLNALGEAVAVTANSVVFLDAMQEQLTEILPATTEMLSNQVSLQSRFNVLNLFGEPALTDLSVVIDSPDSLLHIAQSSDLGSSDMQLRLPLELQGEIRNLNGDFRLGTSEIYGTGSWTQADAQYRGDSRLAEFNLSCSSFSNCDFQTEMLSNLIEWRFGSYYGENISVSAPLRFGYANDEMRLATEPVQIVVSSVRDASDPDGLNVAAKLTLEEVELRVGELISGGFNFSSQELQLDNSVADLSNPAISGKLQIEEDVFTGILEFDLDQSLRLGVGLQHFFLRDTGDVVLQLAAYDFTEARPLSALVSSKQFDADIAAGQWEGLANISWSRQPDDSWRFGGPIALKLDRLSGYYEDYLFVDLSTDLFAEATTPPGIAVTNPANASIGRIDIGLPLENLSWKYSFDSLTSVLQISDFTTDLLGGTLSIAQARYNPARDRQQVDVVLADLSVESLVALAEYPNLQADGFISGYLPFIIEGNTVTIERGLVGALNPGGNIRYTPTNPVPSTNQSLRLVNEALSNYQYQNMDTDVTYDADGELLLGVQLRGKNPDMNNGQAINLNVNISDNIPSLLRSLQASRIITEELEAFVRQR